MMKTKFKMLITSVLVASTLLTGCGSSSATSGSSSSSASADSTSEESSDNQIGTAKDSYSLDLSGTECVIPEGKESDALLKIRKNGLRIGYANDIPYEYIDSNGNFSGFEIEIIEEVCKRLGIDKVVPVLTSWDTYAAEVQQDRMDIFGCGIYVTEDRQKVMNMTNNTYNLSECIVVRKDSGINSSSDLAGKTVESTTGMIYMTLTQQLAEDGTFGKAVEGGQPSSLALDVQTGKCDAAMMDVVMGNYLSSQENMSDLEVLKDWKSQTDSKCSYAVSKSDADFIHEFDTALDSMKDDGTMKKILEPYGLGNNVVSSEDGQVEVIE